MKKNPKDDMKKSIIDNARRDEIILIVNHALEIHYPYLLKKIEGDPDRIITSWWLYLLWYDKKNGHTIRFPELINFRIKNIEKVIKYSYRRFEDYLDIEL